MPLRRATPLTLLALAALLLAPLAASACDNICFVGVACCCDGDFVGCFDEEQGCGGVCGTEEELEVGWLQAEQNVELPPLFTSDTDSAASCSANGSQAPTDTPTATR